AVSAPSASGSPGVPAVRGEDRREAVVRRLIISGGAFAFLAFAVLSVAASTSYVARLGTHGAARWTLNSSVYVNLKAMTAGIWKQQLWSGTCTQPGIRTAVLPSLVVPAGHTLAKTTKIGSVPVTDSGVVLRLIHGTSVVCGSFVAPLPASPTATSTAAPTAT